MEVSEVGDQVRLQQPQTSAGASMIKEQYGQCLEWRRNKESASLITDTVRNPSALAHLSQWGDICLAVNPFQGLLKRSHALLESLQTVQATAIKGKLSTNLPHQQLPATQNEAYYDKKRENEDDFHGSSLAKAHHACEMELPRASSGVLGCEIIPVPKFRDKGWAATFAL
eukprot:1141992-Pelagomonas_calceolata.AAC.1